jgi:hypothetical protein
MKMEMAFFVFSVPLYQFSSDAFEDARISYIYLAPNQIIQIPES